MWSRTAAGASAERQPLVALIPVGAVAHLAEVVLRHLALAELEAGSAEAVSWPTVRRPGPRAAPGPGRPSATSGRGGSGRRSCRRATTPALSRELGGFRLLTRVRRQRPPEVPEVLLLAYSLVVPLQILAAPTAALGACVFALGLGVAVRENA